MRRSDRFFLVLTIVGIAAYVATWAGLGLVADGYDPLRDAISELFDQGAPLWQQRLLAGVLLVTGAALLPVGPVLHRVLPGRGLAGPALAVLAGLGTMLVAFFPCSPGCPGFGTTTTDTMHVLLAGAGYVGLITAPLAFAWRLRDTAWRDLALAGLVLGGLATVGFLVRNLGVDTLGGLQQRVFNTLADAWYVLAAALALRRGSAAQEGEATSREVAATDAATGRSTPDHDSSANASTP